MTLKIHLKCNSITKKINDLIKKIDRGYEETFLQRRHTDRQQKYKKIFNITNFQRNSNKHCNEGSFLQHLLLNCWLECKLVQSKN